MPRAQNQVQRRFRAAAVSVVTFIVVFCIGLLFIQRSNRPNVTVHVVARSYTLRPIALRHAPSLSSSTVDSVAAGTTMDITGFASDNDAQRWITLRWKDAAAYAPASDLAPPKALDVDGADVLKYYLIGMESSETIDEAVKAVDYYARAFPGDVHGDELRWILAERLRSLSQHGGSREAATLRQRANQQYEQLISANGRYAEKAREALTKSPSAAASAVPQRAHSAKSDELEVVGGSGTQTSTAKSGSHEVLVLNQAEVIVRAGKLSQLKAGTVVLGHVAHSVKTNGITAIPAGALCQLTVMAADPSSVNVALGLTSIAIDHRAYAVKSRLVEISQGEESKRAADRALIFHLASPLVIER
ncbi:MAG TPA: hypothetical protein VM578_02120 [Candidatus Saccharimonadales bacterium]|nr:hypothetical protein [Candidatus Saccharimonadales bacterium]